MVFCWLFFNRAKAQTLSRNLFQGITTGVMLVIGIKLGTASNDTFPRETSGQQINGNELSRVTNFYLYNKF